MRRITFAEAVASDLERIYDFIAEDNIDAADRAVARISDRWQALRSKPGIGSKRDELRKGMRSVTEGNYVIFYQAIDDEIEIVRVLHAAQDITAIFGDSTTSS